MSNMKRGLWDDSSVCRLKTAYHRVNILKPIEKCFAGRSPARILEFGPGRGCFVDLARAVWPKADCHVADNDEGLLASLVAERPFLSPHYVISESSLQSIQETFDVIAAVDVWEHLTRGHASAYTEWCWNHLTPGGVLILQTPNWGCPVMPSVFFSDPTHCSPYNEETIRQMFCSAGIPERAVSIHSRRTPGVLGPLRDGMIRLFGLCYGLVFVFFGTVRLKIFTADLVAVVRKDSEGD